MGGEIKDPQRTIPRATLIAAAIVAAIYIAGTASMLVALPSATVDVINGVPQALAAVGDRVQIPAFGTISAILITISSIGGLGSWISGTARLPFVFGLDRYLPKGMGQLHAKFGTPYVALVVQATIVTVILGAALSGSGIHKAFQILIDMTIVLSLAPSLYIFASLPVLRWRARGNNGDVFLVPGGMVGCTLLATLGFATTLLAIGFAVIPPAGEDAPSFLLKVVGGSIALVAVGLAFFLRGRTAERRQARS
jgi:amino acid transporter